MNDDATPVIDAVDLWRSHGRRNRRIEAVTGVSFQARRGQIFGLIGPDGAGKTSVIQMLAGVLEIHKGGAKVDGSSRKALASISTKV